MNVKIRAIAAFTSLCAALMSTPSSASTIYLIDRSIGDGSVSGQIVTDGTIGGLININIESWELLLSSPNLFGGSFLMTNTNSYFRSQGPVQLSATPTALEFNTALSGYFAFTEGSPGNNSGPIRDWAVTGQDWRCSSLQILPQECIAPEASGGPFSSDGVYRSGVIQIGLVAPVPLPAGLPLLAAGIGMLAFVRKRRVAARVVNLNGNGPFSRV